MNVCYCMFVIAFLLLHVAVSVLEFDCITQRIRDELEGMLAEESDSSRDRAEEAKGKTFNNVITRNSKKILF